MDYIKIIKGEIVEIGLSKTGILKDGSTVSGYDLLDEQTLKEEGWLPLEESKPEYNEQTQYLEFIDYDILEDKVIANYVVRDIEVEIIDEYVDDERVAIAEAIIDLEHRLSVLEGE